MKLNELTVFFAITAGFDAYADDGDDNKIIGGELADVGEFPYVVSVQMPFHHICGGSLLSSSVVLTACHCIAVRPGNTRGPLKSRSAEDYTAVAGVVNLANKGFSSYTRLEANALRPHPKCEKPSTGWNWDFGLIQMGGSFPMIPDRIQTVNLPHFPDFPYIIEDLSDREVKCVGAGWGSTSERAKTASLKLLKVDLKLLPLEKCAETLDKYAENVSSSLRFKPEAQVCTVGEEGRDACKGDSGGPLMCDTSAVLNDTAGKKLIATVSWGIGCGRPDVPGGWARLDVAYAWIVDTAQELQRTASSGENGTLKKNVLLNVLLTTVVNAYLYSFSYTNSSLT